MNTASPSESLQNPPLNPFLRNNYRPNIPPLIKLHPIHTRNPMIPLRIIREPPMIHNIIVLAIWREDAVMSRAGADFVVPVQDFGRLRGEGAGGGGGFNVAYAVGVVAPAVITVSSSIGTLI